MITSTANTEGTERLTSETFCVERKKFFLDLHQNPRGQFVRIAFNEEHYPAGDS